jgi:hypothetical protein
MTGQLNSQQLRLPFLTSQPWRVAVIGPTGRYARHQVAAMTAMGTPIIGGVALGRGGTSLDGLPLYDRVGDLPEPPTIALIYTPAEGVRQAIAECAGARIPTIMAVAEYVPVYDTLAAAALARTAGSWLVGPNTLGIFVPGRGLLGSIAPSFCAKGRLAVIARSGTVALALARQLTNAGIGQRIVAHIGGDAVIGRNPHEYLQATRRRRGDRGGFVLRRDWRRHGIRLRRVGAAFSKADHRYSCRTSRASAKADGPRRRVDWPLARERAIKARSSRRRRLPHRDGS